MEAIKNFLQTTGIYQLFFDKQGAFRTEFWQYLVMYVIIGTLLYLAIVKKFEPLLLMPIAFGMLLANLPGANLIHLDYFFDDYYLNPEFGTLAAELKNWFGDAVYTYKDGVYTFAEEVLNQGCWSEVWFTTRSINTFSPRL